MSVKILLRIFLLSLVFIQITGVAGALSFTEIGRYDTIGDAYGVAVSDSYAYVADGESGLVVIDISNSAASILVGNYDTAGSAWGVVASGSYAYVADGENGLVIIDISNSAAPTLAGNYNTAGYAWGVTVSGNYAYVADGESGLVVIDISNSAAPILVGNYNTAGYAQGVAVSGSYAYVADDDNGLVVIDISNTAAPAFAGSYNTIGSGMGVAVSGSYAYVADGDNGLMVIDISNPGTSTLVGSYDTAGSAWGVAVSDSYAYVADGNGLVVIDISNSAAPVLAGSYNTVGWAQGVAVAGSYAYVVDDNGLIIIGESTSGSIYVTSNPSGARVYLDGAYKGTTPYTITSVSVGSHTIKLTKTGYGDITKIVNVVSGGTTSVSETLTLIPPSTGSISILSSPLSASVYFDGVYKGTTPYTITSVSAGSHTIELIKTGYVDITKTVNVANGDTTYVSETLTPISPSTGSISIISNPSGASVYLDRIYKGTTPLKVENIAIGSYTLGLVKEGYSGKTKSVTITKDRTEIFSMALESLKTTAMESTNSIDTNTLDADNKKSDAILVPPTKSDESSSNIFSILLYGGIGAFMLLFLLIAIFISGNKSEPNKRTTNALAGISTEPKKKLSPYWDSTPDTKQPVMPIGAKDAGKMHTVKSKPIINSAPVQSSTTPIITSAFGYKGATIQYKVKVENPTSEPIADIKINLYVPDVFLASESTKSIAMLKPSESKTVTFEIRPTGECGDCEVSGRVIYYDYSAKKTTEVEIPAKSLSIVCPMLKGKEISKSEWHGVINNLVKTEESTKDLDMPAKTLFEMTSRIVKDMNMHQLEPEMTDSPQLFNGVARFYGEGVKGLKYAAQVEVVGGAKKSRLILKTWAEKEEALTGFYHGLLDEIEKRVHVKGYIDNSIVQHFYHYGDNIGTQVKDSIVQRSNIGAGAGDKKCSNCNTVVDASSEFCNKCGEKLEL